MASPAGHGCIPFGNGNTLEKPLPAPELSSPSLRSVPGLKPDAPSLRMSLCRLAATRPGRTSGRAFRLGVNVSTFSRLYRTGAKSDGFSLEERARLGYITGRCFGNYPPRVLSCPTIGSRRFLQTRHGPSSPIHGGGFSCKLRRKIWLSTLSASRNPPLFPRHAGWAKATKKPVTAPPWTPCVFHSIPSASKAR